MLCMVCSSVLEEIKFESIYPSIHLCVCVCVCLYVSGLHKIFYFLGPQGQRKYFLPVNAWESGILCFFINLITTKQDSVYSTQHFSFKIDVYFNMATE